MGMKLDEATMRNSRKFGHNAITEAFQEGRDNDDLNFLFVAETLLDSAMFVFIHFFDEDEKQMEERFLKIIDRAKQNGEFG